MFNLSRGCILFIFSTTLLTGCLSLKEKVAIKEKQDEAEQQRLMEEEIKSYGPPTVIYRIDDKRFFTLEKYSQKRGGVTYYNNTAKGIHQEVLGDSVCRYRGRLIWSTDRDDAFVFPAVLSSRYSHCVGTKYGCINVILVTLNGGKKFAPVNAGFGITTYDPEYYSAKLDIIVTSEGFYLGESSCRLENDELSFPGGRVFYYYSDNFFNLHDDVGDKKNPPENLRTPSGQTRFDCSDYAIYPVSKL